MYIAFKLVRRLLRKIIKKLFSYHPQTTKKSKANTYSNYMDEEALAIEKTL